jgi:hypothetical protein
VISPVAPRLSRRRPVAVVLLGLAALVAALLAPGAATSAQAATPGGTAFLRPAHLVPELGAMDIRLVPFTAEGGDGSDAAPLLETTAAYGAVGDYVPLPAGRYAVGVRPAGSDPASEPLLQLTFELGAGEAYTVAGLGTKDSPRLELLTDELATPSAGTAEVRVLAASRRAPVVQVGTDDGTELGRAGIGTATGYTPVQAGDLDLAVEPESGPPAQATATVAAGSLYTLLVLDAAEGDGLEVRAVLDAAGTSATPEGGAATGFGGLAGTGGPADAARVAVVLVTGAGLLALLGLLLTRSTGPRSALPVGAGRGTMHRTAGRGRRAPGRP